MAYFRPIPYHSRNPALAYDFSSAFMDSTGFFNAFRFVIPGQAFPSPLGMLGIPGIPWLESQDYSGIPYMANVDFAPSNKCNTGRGSGSARKS